MKNCFLKGLFLKIRAARQVPCRQAIRTSAIAPFLRRLKQSFTPLRNASGGTPILAAIAARRALLAHNKINDFARAKSQGCGYAAIPSILAAIPLYLAAGKEVRGFAHNKMDEFAKANSWGCVLAAIPLLFLSCSKPALPPQKPVIDSTAIEKTAGVLSDAALEENSDISVDYDLTTMNANMVYAQVFNLMLEPEKFENATFKIRGNFIKASGPQGQPAYAVIIKDALACCQQGLEFIWDFAGAEPRPDQEILVIGQYTLTTTPDGFSHNYLAARICQVF